jgi:hypothetical protein
MGWLLGGLVVSVMVVVGVVVVLLCCHLFGRVLRKWM